MIPISGLISLTLLFPSSEDPLNAIKRTIIIKLLTRNCIQSMCIWTVFTKQFEFQQNLDLPENLYCHISVASAPSVNEKPDCQSIVSPPLLPKWETANVFLWKFTIKLSFQPKHKRQMERDLQKIKLVVKNLYIWSIHLHQA